MTPAPATVHRADDDRYMREGTEWALCRYISWPVLTDDDTEVTCRACLRKMGPGDDGQGRLRKTVYLPPECWTWLEATAAHDQSARSDVLEGLVLLAMDEAEDKARAAG